MKYVLPTLGTCLLLGTVSLPTSAQNQDDQNSPSGVEATESITGKATVQDIDYQNRTVTLKGERGNIATVKVGAEVRNFNQIKKGDQVTARYAESLALGIHKSNEPPNASEEQMLLRAQPGEKPGGAAITTKQITATVQSLNRNKREVTLRLPGGETKTLKVGKDVQALDQLQPGDQVAATYTEAFMINVTKPNG